MTEWSQVFLVCLSLALLTLLQHATADDSGKRVAAEAFENATMIRGAVVKCDVMDEQEEGEVYPAEVWVCRNISINDTRLQYETGFGHVYTYDEHDSEGRSVHVPDDFTGLNDLAEICRQLLREHGVTKTLWVAHARHITMSAVGRPRLIFLQTGRAGESSSHDWEETAPAKGYIGTLQCMLVREQ